jgi:hypothetical protein
MLIYFDYDAVNSPRSQYFVEISDLPPLSVQDVKGLICPRRIVVPLWKRFDDTPPEHGRATRDVIFDQQIL